MRDHSKCTHPKNPNGYQKCNRMQDQKPRQTTWLELDIVRVGNDLLMEHNLHTKGWHVVASPTLKRKYGLADYSKRQIRISLPLAESNPWEHTLETLKHEVAHALVGPGSAPHGEDWRRACARTGAQPKACYGDEVTVEHRIQEYCTECQKVVGGRHNMPRKNRYAYRHSACGGRIEFWQTRD